MLNLLQSTFSCEFPAASQLISPLGFPPGEDLVPEPEIQVQEVVQKRRGPPGAQPQRERLHGLQLPSLPRSVGEQHPSEHPDQQTSGPAADAQLVAALPGGL